MTTYQIGDYVKTKKPTATMESGTYGVIRNTNNAGLTVDYIGHGVNGLTHDDARWLLEVVEPLEYLQHGMETAAKELHRLTLTVEQLQGECRRIIFNGKKKETLYEKLSITDAPAAAVPLPTRRAARVTTIATCPAWCAPSAGSPSTGTSP